MIRSQTSVQVLGRNPHIWSMLHERRESKMPYLEYAWSSLLTSHQWETP